jgi:hypothetical protein
MVWLKGKAYMGETLLSEANDRQIKSWPMEPMLIKEGSNGGVEGLCAKLLQSVDGAFC